MKKNLSILSIITIVIIAMTTGCKKSSSPQTLFSGDTKSLGTGNMRSWVKTDGNGKAVSVGFTINAAAIASLPARDTMIMLMLPMNTSGSMMNMTMAMPFDHIEVDWSAMGDTMSSIFNHPHLDCHFFTISSSAQMNIMMGMDTVMMGASYVPGNCMGDGIAEAGMGTHWYDTTLSIYHGSAFNQTYMYGFYQGNMTFVEVMCAKTYLDTKPTFSGNISQPSSFKTSGYYPMKYTVSYDATANEYTYSLDNLMAH